MTLINSLRTAVKSDKSENNPPGTLDWPNYEAVSALFRTNLPSKCFPIPDQEIQTNPHLSGS